MSTGFQIELNGEPYRVDGDTRLAALIERLKLKPGRIAIEINRAIVPRAAWNGVTVKPGDVIEIVNFVGGG